MGCFRAGVSGGLFCFGRLLFVLFDLYRFWGWVLYIWLLAVLYGCGNKLLSLLGFVRVGVDCDWVYVRVVSCCYFGLVLCLILVFADFTCELLLILVGV